MSRWDWDWSDEYRGVTRHNPGSGMNAFIPASPEYLNALEELVKSIIDSAKEYEGDLALWIDKAKRLLAGTDKE